MSDDWTHWLIAGLLIWLGLIAIALMWWSWAMDRRGEQRDAELVRQNHVDVVEVPLDWADHEDWIS